MKAFKSNKKCTFRSGAVSPSLMRQGAALPHGQAQHRKLLLPAGQLSFVAKRSAHNETRSAPPHLFFVFVSIRVSIIVSLSARSKSAFLVPWPWPLSHFTQPGTHRGVRQRGAASDRPHILPLSRRVRVDACTRTSAAFPVAPLVLLPHAFRPLLFFAGTAEHTPSPEGARIHRSDTDESGACEP